MPIIDPSAPHGVKLLPTDTYSVKGRLDSICTVATDEELVNLLRLMGIDYSGMDSTAMRTAVRIGLDDYMTDVLGYGPLDWQFDDTIYKFQAQEARKVILGGNDFLPVSASYFFWEGEFNGIKTEAKDIATSLGYSYSLAGPLVEKSFGMITGIVAGGSKGMANIVFSTTYPTTSTEAKARAGAFMLEAISNQVEAPVSQFYSLNMNGFADKPALTASTLGSFNWSANSVYDYVLFLSSAGTYVNFSDLTGEDLAFYMKNPNVARLRLADAMSRMKESLSSGMHMRVWGYLRQFEFSRRQLSEMKEYVMFLRSL